MGVVLAGDTKDYAIPKFLEMMESYYSDLDVVFAVDYSRLDIPFEQIKVPEMRGSLFATEMVYYGKEALKKYALENDYDRLIWQGIDCYYVLNYDLQILLKYCNQYDIVGGLVAGRNRENYPVCREFVKSNGKITTSQQELSHRLLDCRWPTPINGYIGSDATVISRKALEEVSMDGYEHWHLRPNKDKPLGELGPEEWFMYSAIKRNKIIPLCETFVRPYHAHEDGKVVRYPGEVYRLEDLRFDKK